MPDLTDRFRLKAAVQILPWKRRMNDRYWGQKQSFDADPAVTKGLWLKKVRSLF